MKMRELSWIEKAAAERVEANQSERTLKSYKPLTPKQEGEFWAEIEVQTNNAYKAACALNLEELNSALFVLNGITKRLNRSEIGKKINDKSAAKLVTQ